MAHAPTNPTPKVGDTRIRGHYIQKGPRDVDAEVVDCEPDDPRAGGWFVERWVHDDDSGHENWVRDHESFNTVEEAIDASRS
jgi:hypothetical protein